MENPLATGPPSHQEPGGRRRRHAGEPGCPLPAVLRPSAKLQDSQGGADRHHRPTCCRSRLGGDCTKWTVRVMVWSGVDGREVYNLSLSYRLAVWPGVPVVDGRVSLLCGVTTADPNLPPPRDASGNGTVKLFGGQVQRPVRHAHSSRDQNSLPSFSKRASIASRSSLYLRMKPVSVRSRLRLLHPEHAHTMLRGTLLPPLTRGYM